MLNVFYDCMNLKSIIFPESVTEIGESAFNGCTSLKTINVPFNHFHHYKMLLPEELHPFIVELPAEEK